MDYLAARLNMVESQLRPNRVTDPRLLEAFGSVPRERFVPPALRAIAYVDEDIHLGGRRYLMEPMVFGRLLQAAAVGPGDAVLDIGCGSGYSAALLARLAATVVAVESDSKLAREAAKALAELAIDNVLLFEGPLAEGCPKQAPYDAIILEGAVERLPQPLLDQLAEGGRLAAVVRRDGVGRATLMTKVGGVVSGRIIFDAATPLLPGFAEEPGFVF